MPATMTGSIRPKPCSPASSISERPVAAQSSSAVRLAPVTICVDAGLGAEGRSAAAGRERSGQTGRRSPARRRRRVPRRPVSRPPGARGGCGSASAGWRRVGRPVCGAGRRSGAAARTAVRRRVEPQDRPALPCSPAEPPRCGGWPSAGRRGRLASALSCSPAPFCPAAATPSGVCSAILSPAASGIRAARREASARIRAIASSSAVVDCSGGDRILPPGPRGRPYRTLQRVPAAPDAPATAWTGSGTLPLPTVRLGELSGSPSLRSPSASRSLITLRGKKCSRCWRRTQRRRSTSASKNLR